MKNKKVIKRCQNDYNDCKRIAKHFCVICDSVFCQKCYDETWGECPLCEPPRLYEISKNKKK